MIFPTKLYNEGLISIIGHNLCVFVLFPPSLQKSLGDQTEISNEVWLGNVHLINESGGCGMHN